MPSRTSPQQYGEAILDHIRTGAYPDSEGVVSSDLPCSALPGVSKLIEQAREDVKKSLRQTSAESAPDIDGWVSQAKQLRVDIQNSQDEAQGIVEQARHGESLQAAAIDAANQVHLLEGELAFDESLEIILERLQALRSQLDQIQQAVLHNELPNAVDLLGGFGAAIPSTPSSNSRVAAVFSSKTAEIRSDVREKLVQCWSAHVQVDRDTPSIQIRGNLDNNSKTLDLDSTVSAMRKLGVLDDILLPFCKSVEVLILLPRLHLQVGGTVSPYVIEDDTLYRAEPSSDLSAEALFSDLKALINFLCHHLPTSVTNPLAGQLAPPMISRLLSTWLASAVPHDLGGMEDFQKTLSLVQTFGDWLVASKWPGKADLDKWANGISDLWLSKRQETSLNQVREILLRGHWSTETVERVETQVLSRDDEVFAGSGGGDDWNAGWSDEEEHLPVEISRLATVDSHRVANAEEDVSAWGLEDEKDDANTTGEGMISGTADEDAEAWGWGDEEEAESPIATQPSAAGITSVEKPSTNGIPISARSADRKVTLRETYTITSLAKEIIDIIRRVIYDSAVLESAEYANSSIARSASSLLSLAGLTLAMYRAGSSNAYAGHRSGSMFIYNDSLWLAEQLQSLNSQTVTSSGKVVQSRSAYNLNLPIHSSNMESHGKRAYGREMESQRTIVTDLLDGAQGFTNCTEHPFNRECDTAISSTIDRLRELHTEWKAVLSQSALLQSLGSLLSTVCSKMIVDIEDMSDISEPESQQLTTYCSQIDMLQDLFSPQQSEPVSAPNDEPLPLTAMYTPAWLKFQYLKNILESSLVDIKYLWTDGELSLEFEKEELVDLVVALFADSPYRRGAIGEIRQSKP